MEKIAAASVEELQQAEEVGPKVAESIYLFFREPQNQLLIERLKTAEPVVRIYGQAEERRSADRSDICSYRNLAGHDPRGSQV